MQKIKAFITALIIFAVIVCSVHFGVTGKGLKADGDGFGTWYNNYKDISYNALSQNLGEDTMLVMGSSEFRHGLSTKYHPRNLFKYTDVDLMTIGGPYNQTLFHTIALGSLEPHLKNRKLVLLCSPTWFKKGGVKKKAYALRFSESEYMAFMGNENVPDKIKKYVDRRSEKLLSVDSGKQKFAKRVYAENTGEGAGKPYSAVYRFSRLLVTDRDFITTRFAMSTMGRGQINEHYEVSDGEPEWDKLKSKAAAKNGKNSTNPYYMSDEYWKMDFSKRESKMPGYYDDETLTDSDEFRDLDMFLALCESCGIDTEVIIMPVNGRWYDHAGLTKDKRAACINKIAGICEAHGAAVVSLDKYDYEPYVILDAVHPWGKGWVLINEQIYKFYHKDDEERSQA